MEGRPLRRAALIAHEASYFRHRPWRLGQGARSSSSRIHLMESEPFAPQGLTAALSTREVPARASPSRNLVRAASSPPLINRAVQRSALTNV
jgi:hypothetical protein